MIVAKSFFQAAAACVLLVSSIIAAGLPLEIRQENGDCQVVGDQGSGGRYLDETGKGSNEFKSAGFGSFPQGYHATWHGLPDNYMEMRFGTQTRAQTYAVVEITYGGKLTKVYSFLVFQGRNCKAQVPKSMFKITKVKIRII